MLRRARREADRMRTLRAVLLVLGGVLLLAAQSSLAQTRLGITAAQRAGDYRAFAGKRLTFVCPATDGATAPLSGTDTYTKDPPICAAAIHAGALKAGQAGVVSIDIGNGAKEFRGSQRNGLTSRSYGAWPYSYTVARDGCRARSLGRRCGTRFRP